MKSTVIKRPEGQLTLNFEKGASERHKSLRECIAAGVYRNGLGNTAIDLDIAPGNLSVQISDDPSRHFSVDSLERYIEKTGDTSPIHYLVDKFMGEDAPEFDFDEMKPALVQLVPLLKKMGLV